MDKELGDRLVESLVERYMHEHPGLDREVVEACARQFVEEKLRAAEPAVPWWKTALTIGAVVGGVAIVILGAMAAAQGGQTDPFRWSKPHNTLTHLPTGQQLSVDKNGNVLHILGKNLGIQTAEPELAALFLKYRQATLGK